MATTAYAGPIIDAHIHLWRYSEPNYPWLADQSLEGLRKDHLPHDYLALAGSCGITGSVHVEAGRRAEDCIAETQWLNEADLPAGVGDRYVAHVPLGEPGAGRQLEQQAAHDRVVGIRDIMTWHPDPAKSRVGATDRMESPSWRRDFARLRHNNLVFDLLISPWQAQKTFELAAAHPDIVIAVNHCGSPMDRDRDGMNRWRDGLHRMAEAPNVVMKISDPVAYDPDWTEGRLREVIETCVEAFGPKRAMFATDYPVSGLHIGFSRWVDVFRQVVAAFSEDEQTEIFHGTAARTYRF